MKIKALLWILPLSVLCTNLIAQNNALDFDGTNDYVEVADDDAFDFTSFTIEAWIYPDDLSGSHTIMGKSKVEWQPASTAFDLETSGTLLYGSVWDASGIQKYIQAGTLTTGLWQHVAMTWTSGGSIILYINGKNVGSQPSTFSGIIANAGSFKIGVYPWVLQYYWNGKIDEVRVWDFVKTEGQLKTGMYQELNGSESGLVAYYKMNESNGTALDDATSNNLDGTLTNMTGSEWTVSAAFFGPKNCLDFDGSNDYVDLGNSSDLKPTTEVTLECWINPESWSITGNHHVFAGNSQSGGYNIALGYPSGTEIGWAVYSGGQYRRVDADVSGFSGWHHVAGTFDGRYVRLYVDGILSDSEDMGTTGNTISYSSSNSTLLGAEAGSGSTPSNYDNNYDGKLDEVRFWNVARTNTEICENMCKMLTGNETGLVGYYTFDRNTGDDLPDFSGDDNNGTLHNMADDDWESSTAFNTWLNTSSSDWSTAANWSRQSVPTSTDNVGVHDQSGSDPSIGAEIECNHLVVGDEVSLAFNYSGSHTIHGSVFNIGHTNINNGTDLNITGSLYMLPWSSLDLKAGGALTIGSNLYNNILGISGTFNVLSNSSGTGSLIVNGTFPNDGKINVERYVSESIWHLISSPIVDGTANIFLGDYLQNYNETTNNWSDIVDPATPLTPVQGYSFWGEPGESATYTFTGTPNTGNQSIPITYAGPDTDNKGFNLLGNPYPSSIDWSGLDHIYGAVYYWNGSDYIEWNNGTGTGGATQYIPPMQGFFIKTTTGGTFNVGNGNRTHNGANNFYKMNEQQAIQDGLVLVASGTLNQDELCIQFREDGQEGFELHNDASKLLIYAEGVSQLFSYCPDGRLSIDVRPMTEYIPLGFVNEKEGRYSIGINEIYGINTAILEDKETGIMHDLHAGPYEFMHNISNPEDRFILHLEPTAIDEDLIPIFSTYVANNVLYIVNQESKNGTLNVLDISGKVVSAYHLNGFEQQQIPLNLNTGIYIINITTEENTYSDKLFIK